MVEQWQMKQTHTTLLRCQLASNSRGAIVLTMVPIACALESSQEGAGAGVM